MKNNSLVSVVLCTYNGEKYLEAQINSIINQTYKNIEIIVDHFLSIIFLKQL